MPQFYKIDKERRLVLSAASGVFSRDAVGHMQELSKDPDFDPSYFQIADFTQVTKIELIAQDVHELAQRSVLSPQSRRALLVRNDVAYGLGRMFGMLPRKPGRNGDSRFRNLEEALDWVFSKSTSA
jgi:hypothetical protein